MSLNISGIVINENAARCLVKAFGNNLQLEKLFLNHCQITSPIILVFCQQLKLNSLKVFELRANKICDRAIEELAITILHWDLLKSIELGNNNINNQCILLLDMLTKDVDLQSIFKNSSNNNYIVKSFIKVLDFASKPTGKRVIQFLNKLSKTSLYNSNI